MSYSRKINYFNLDQICESGQCFRMKKLNDGYFEVIAGNRMVRIIQAGNEITFSCSEEEFHGFWKEYFDLDRDYAEVIAMINPNDQYLTNATNYGSGIRILKQDLWETMVSFLISQQNNIKRIRHCIELLCNTYGEEYLFENGEKYYGFPTPEKLALLEDDDLKACNLGYRSKYVVRTAKAIVSGEVDLEAIQEASHKDAKKMLLSCYGIGEKVADCICLFALQHLDSFPIDTHIKQVMDIHYKRGFPNRRYKGYRGIMQQYIFFYDLNK